MPRCCVLLSAKPHGSFHVGLLVVTLAFSGCVSMPSERPASEAEQRTCDRLIDVVGKAMIFGSARMDAATAELATRRGLGGNIAAAGDGRTYIFTPRYIPTTL